MASACRTERMTWKTSSVMEEKLRFVMQYDSGEYTMSELCQRYGISRETGDGTLRRYRATGITGLVERSRAPASKPDAGRDRADGVGTAASAHALGTAQAQASVGTGRAGANLACRQHHRSPFEARRFSGGAQETLPYRTIQRAVGARRWSQARVVCGFQGLVPHCRRRTHRSTDHLRCAQPVLIAHVPGLKCQGSVRPYSSSAPLTTICHPEGRGAT